MHRVEIWGRKPNLLHINRENSYYSPLFVNAEAEERPPPLQLLLCTMSDDEEAGGFGAAGDSEEEGGFGGADESDSEGDDGFGDVGEDFGAEESDEDEGGKCRAAVWHGSMRSVIVRVVLGCALVCVLVCVCVCSGAGVDVAVAWCGVREWVEGTRGRAVNAHHPLLARCRDRDRPLRVRRC